MERILGKIEGKEPGPLIICIAALHGNEQIGLHAFRNVASAILNHNIDFHGKLVGIAGNIKAIEESRRFLDVDLNRVWDEDKVDLILNGDEVLGAEDEELREIYQIIERESVGPYNLKVIVDLHSTSAGKGNFLIVPEEEGSHPIIEALTLPIVLELNKYLKGTLLAYYYSKGYVSFAFEGGTIGTSEVYRLHTSGIWEILERAGAISSHDHEDEDHYITQLRDSSEQLPAKVIIKYHHPVRMGDGFKMLPGFSSFEPVHEGQQLALDKNGPVLSPMDGLIFMPLYQAEGDDGFFIAEELK